MKILSTKFPFFLAESGNLKIELYLSFRWSRQLIEDVTGFFTGSIYNETLMVNKGFLGEYETPTSGRTIVVKNHGHRYMEFAAGMVLVVRNPYDAIVADFNRQMSHKHTGSADPAQFEGEKWQKFVKQHAQRWRSEF